MEDGESQNRKRLLGNWHLGEFEGLRADQCKVAMAVIGPPLPFGSLLLI